LLLTGCGRECIRRCSGGSHTNLCESYCRHCCNVCKCMPPGHAGSHKECCPCYNNWKESDGGPHCP
ncbi:gibberellin-regulated protein 6, partial [Phtheirospermum japonicum]